MPPLREGEADDAVADGVDVAYEGGSHHHWQGNQQPEHELGSYLLKCIKIKTISILCISVFSTKPKFFEKTCCPEYNTFITEDILQKGLQLQLFTNMYKKIATYRSDLNV